VVPRRLWGPKELGNDFLALYGLKTQDMGIIHRIWHHILGRGGDDQSGTHGTVSDERRCKFDLWLSLSVPLFLAGRNLAADGRFPTFSKRLARSRLEA
jgi:hypothetical protein